MTTRKASLQGDPDVSAGLPEGVDWNNEKFAAIKAIAKKAAAQRSPEEQLRLQLAAIQANMELFIQDNLPFEEEKNCTLERFLDRYLKTLHLTFKKFATSIDSTDGNLKKYLSGERKFNTDLAMKFGAFFHTPPELWLKVHIKNELLLLSKQKKLISRYKKYDYRKVYQLPEEWAKAAREKPVTKKAPATK